MTIKVSQSFLIIKLNNVLRQINLKFTNQLPILMGISLPTQIPLFRTLLQVSVFSIQYTSTPHVAINLQGGVALALPFWAPSKS